MRKYKPLRFDPVLATEPDDLEQVNRPMFKIVSLLHDEIERLSASTYTSRDIDVGMLNAALMLLEAHIDDEWPPWVEYTEMRVEKDMAKALKVR